MKASRSMCGWRDTDWQPAVRGSQDELIHARQGYAECSRFGHFGGIVSAADRRSPPVAVGRDGSVAAWLGSGCIQFFRVQIWTSC
jgi:hypothetical protein